MEKFTIEAVKSLTRKELDELCDVLVDCVEGGASVSFMLPIERRTAVEFWTGVVAGAADGKRVLLIAKDEAGCIGTVQILLDQPENQPHRGDLAKMLVHRRARGRGVGAALLRHAEAAALRAGKSLLVLDTANPAAERLYERGGWIACGLIPNYALMPDGPLCATRLYYKQLAPPGHALSTQDS
ncbi:GNAT family N-acetyltransferase [Paraburkholderia solisilvae]|uniref:Acetyltransferase n=1 Tax=Paraburkholderia solisilvae TaxID=624376 RepID=A0A6J5DN18_9BURK|nr:GNAT family N-acetyltransferase [Paraburkholderia solisilvae]CAB3755609.1 Acetyltransferase [Paraburkholderia solisilvae]